MQMLKVKIYNVIELLNGDEDSNDDLEESTFVGT